MLVWETVCNLSNKWSFSKSLIYKAQSYLEYVWNCNFTGIICIFKRYCRTWSIWNCNLKDVGSEIVKNSQARLSFSLVGDTFFFIYITLEESFCFTLCLSYLFLWFLWINEKTWIKKKIKINKCFYNQVKQSLIIPCKIRIKVLFASNLTTFKAVTILSCGTCARTHIVETNFFFFFQMKLILFIL